MCFLCNAFVDHCLSFLELQPVVAVSGNPNDKEELEAYLRLTGLIFGCFVNVFCFLFVSFYGLPLSCPFPQFPPPPTRNFMCGTIPDVIALSAE